MFSKSDTYILGIGTDIVDVRRVQVVLERHMSRFKSRIYTAAETAYCESASHPGRRLLRYANRFAAKEAAYKALGAGRGDGITWQDMEVISTDSRGQSAPSLLLHGRAKYHVEQKVLNSSMAYKTQLSLSDEYPYALAFVILSIEKNANL